LNEFLSETKNKNCNAGDSMRQNIIKIKNNKKAA